MESPRISKCWKGTNPGPKLATRYMIVFIVILKQLFIDHSSVDWTGGCFLGKMCSDRRKKYGCEQKKTRRHQLCYWYLGSGPLRNAANSSIVPTEFAAEPTTKMKSSKANLVTWTFYLPPKRELSILLNFFFPFTDIWYFFSSPKLHFCRTEFQKRRWSCDFPPRKTPVAQKHRPVSRQEKMAFPTPPHRVILELPSPSPRVCTVGARTLTSQPKFLESIGYQICLAMVLRWRASAQAPLSSFISAW